MYCKEYGVRSEECGVSYTPSADMRHGANTDPTDRGPTQPDHNSTRRRPDPPIFDNGNKGTLRLSHHQTLARFHFPDRGIRNDFGHYETLLPNGEQQA